jgi:hypothetical protein
MYFNDKKEYGTPRLVLRTFGAEIFEKARNQYVQLTHGPRFAIYILWGLRVQLARARFTHIALGPVGLGLRRRPGPLAEIAPIQLPKKTRRNLGCWVSIRNNGFSAKSNQFCPP